MWCNGIEQPVDALNRQARFRIQCIAEIFFLFSDSRGSTVHGIYRVTVSCLQVSVHV